MNKASFQVTAAAHYRQDDLTEQKVVTRTFGLKIRISGIPSHTVDTSK